MRKKTALFVIACFLLIPVFGQENISPYSMFGAGRTESRGTGTNEAMGGTGIAFTSKNTLNNINPASYTGIDSLNFLFESGLSMKYTQFESAGNKVNLLNGHLEYLSMGTRLTRWWGASVGINSYSRVGYTIHTTDQVEGALVTYPKTFTGQGGITRYYFGNAIRLFKRLSLGINASYLQGTIQQDESLAVVNLPAVTVSNINYIRNFMLDYGLQYKILDSKYKLTLGLIYNHQQNFNTTSKEIISNNGDSTNIDVKNSNFIIPARYGIGLAFQKPEKFRVGADYERRDWSAVRFNNPLLRTRTSEKYSFGFEYLPAKNIHEAGLQNWEYRLGFFYDKSYLIINNIPVNTRAITLGFGIPLRKSLSHINISLEGGITGTTERGLIQENYIKMDINFSLKDIWFQKPKYD